MRKMRGQAPELEKEEESSSTEERSPAATEKEHEEEREQEAIDYSYDDEWEKREGDENARFQRIRTGQSLRPQQSGEYHSSPFDLDRVNTKDSFTRSGAGSRTSSPARSLKSKKSGKSLKSQAKKSTTSLNK